MEKQKDYLEKLKSRVERKRRQIELLKAGNDFCQCLSLDGQIFAIEQMIMDYNDWMSD